MLIKKYCADSLPPLVKNDHFELFHFSPGISLDDSK